MSSRNLARRIAFSLLLLVPGAAAAQTTGDLLGRVTDEQGGALPGVTVEAQSAALQGTRTVVTDAAGAYRIVLLPPGSYRVTATLPGFARVEQVVAVSLARTSTLDFRLAAAVREAIVVSGEAPVVDTTSAAIGTTVDEQHIRSLPSGRNYTSLVQISPGVSTQTSNTDAFANTITVYGSTGLENSLRPGRRRTTGVEYGAQGKELNYEFIQEIDVKTGGYEAEFGRSTGGDHQRHHEIGRQRVPRRRSSATTTTTRSRPTTSTRTRISSGRRPVSRGTTSAPISAATSGGTASGSSAPTTGSTTRPTRARRRCPARSTTGRSRPRARGTWARRS